MHLDVADLAAKLGAYYRPDPTASERWDGYQNTLTGLNTDRDKRTSTSFVAPALSQSQAAELWEGNDLAARIVETWPSEMLREGYDIHVSEDKGEVAEKVEERMRELGVNDALWRAMSFENAYGGGAVLVGANDGRELNQPLDVERVSKIEFLLDLEPDELTPWQWTTEIGPEFSKPELWRMNPLSEGGVRGAKFGELVHSSRLILFRGIRVSRRRTRGTQAGWGASRLSRASVILRDHGITWSSAAALVQDFAQAVLKIKGLAELFATNKKEVIRNRMEALDMARSVLRVLLLDADEDFERKPTPLTGLPDLLDRFSTRLAAAADMPLTLLMGQSPAGLNATGESDIRFFYDRVRNRQGRVLKAPVERMARLVMSELGIPEPDEWSVKFRPLWQQSDKEVAETRKLVTESDVMNVQAGILSPDEVARSHYGGDGYSMEIKIDLDERRREREAEVEEARQLLAEMNGGGTGPTPNNNPNLPDEEE